MVVITKARDGGGKKADAWRGEAPAEIPLVDEGVSLRTRLRKLERRVSRLCYAYKVMMAIIGVWLFSSLLRPLQHVVNHLMDCFHRSAVAQWIVPLFAGKIRGPWTTLLRSFLPFVWVPSWYTRSSKLIVPLFSFEAMCPGGPPSGLSAWPGICWTAYRVRESWAGEQLLKVFASNQWSPYLELGLMGLLTGAIFAPIVHLICRPEDMHEPMELIAASYTGAKFSWRRRLRALWQLMLYFIVPVVLGKLPMFMRLEWAESIETLRLIIDRKMVVVPLYHPNTQFWVLVWQRQYFWIAVHGTCHVALGNTWGSCEAAAYLAMRYNNRIVTELMFLQSIALLLLVWFIPFWCTDKSHHPRWTQKSKKMMSGHVKHIKHQQTKVSSGASDKRPERGASIQNAIDAMEHQLLDELATQASTAAEDAAGPDQESWSTLSLLLMLISVVVLPVLVQQQYYHQTPTPDVREVILVTAVCQWLFLPVSFLLMHQHWEMFTTVADNLLVLPETSFSQKKLPRWQNLQNFRAQYKFVASWWAGQRRAAAAQVWGAASHLEEAAAGLFRKPWRKDGNPAEAAASWPAAVQAPSRSKPAGATQSARRLQVPSSSRLVGASGVRGEDGREAQTGARRAEAAANRGRQRQAGASHGPSPERGRRGKGIQGGGGASQAGPAAEAAQSRQAGPAAEAAQSRQAGPAAEAAQSRAPAPQLEPAPGAAAAPARRVQMVNKPKLELEVPAPPEEAPQGTSPESPEMKRALEQIAKLSAQISEMTRVAADLSETGGEMSKAMSEIAAVQANIGRLAAIQGGPAAAPALPSSSSPGCDDSDACDRTRCVVCLDREREAVVLPCFHMCLCLKCGSKLTKLKAPCPLCRQAISKVKRLYQ